MSKKKKAGASGEAPTKQEELPNSNSSVSFDDSSPEPEPAQEAIVSKDEDVKGGLTKSEREALRKKAKEVAEKEIKDKLPDDYLKKAVEEEKEAAARKLKVQGKKVEKVPHTVNLSSAADHIRINGEVFKHGQTYMVTPGQKSAMLDMEHRGYEEERIRKGQGKNEYGLRERDGIKSGSGVVQA